MAFYVDSNKDGSWSRDRRCSATPRSDQPGRLDAHLHAPAWPPAPTGCSPRPRTATAFQRPLRPHAHRAVIHKRATPRRVAPAPSWPTQPAASLPNMFGANTGQQRPGGPEQRRRRRTVPERLCGPGHQAGCRGAGHRPVGCNATNATLDSTGAAAKYGFIVSGDGIGAAWSVGSSGDAFGRGEQYDPDGDGPAAGRNTTNGV